MKNWLDEMNDGQSTYEFPDCLHTMCRFSINGGVHTKESQSFDNVEIPSNFNQQFKQKERMSN